MADSVIRGDPITEASQRTHVVAVASGMRGVGKSSIAGLLAAAFCRCGLRAGLLDTDISSASIPRMFGVHQQPAAIGSEELVPVESPGGIKLVLLSRLLSGEDSRIWNSPLMIRVIKRFWRDIVHGHLDYLIINLPPGAPDVALTTIQSLPPNGIVLVTSPRDMAEMALRETATMFKQLGIPLIGLVDNMRHVVCPACGTQICVFGTGQAEFSAQLLETEILGRMPLDPDLTCLCDSGEIENYRSVELASIAEKVRHHVTTTKAGIVGG